MADESNKTPELVPVDKVPANAVPLQPNGKRLGGITGKGFMPGQGGFAGRSHKPQYQFGEHLRKWLQEQDWIRDKDGKSTGKRELRLKTIMKQLARDKPEVLLYYAFGKPVEIHEVASAEGTEIEFVVRVNGKDIP